MRAGWREDEEVVLGCLEFGLYLGHPRRGPVHSLEVWVGDTSLGLVKTAQFLRTWAEFSEAKVARQQSQSGFLVGSRFQKLTAKLHDLWGLVKSAAEVALGTGSG